MQSPHHSPHQYKIILYDKAYTKYQLYDIPSETGLTALPPVIDPIQQKLFTNDIVSDTGKRLFSEIRNAPAMPGVIVLEDNRTYGRTSNNKRLFYRCTLYDPALPDFIVSYSPSSHEFSKNPKNMFVLIKFGQWVGKHPEGVLVKTIGRVDDLSAYYEYRLYCSKLVQTNGKLNQFIYKTPRHSSATPLPTNHIFTIDPPHTTAYDDALELSYTGSIAKISIHISDVVARIHQLHLWDKLAENIRIPATIYMPDKRHSLLPPLLERECSLAKNTSLKHVITTTFHVDLETYQIIQTAIQTQQIQITENYVYDSPELLRDPQYNHLYDITQRLAAHQDPPPTNSVELVEYWMLKTNAHIATTLRTHQAGIFRTVKQVIPTTSPRTTIQRVWNTYHRGKYQLYDNTQPGDIDLTHDALQLPQYLHITSPIRRLVDILNQIILYDKHICTLPPEAVPFLQKWSTHDEIDHLNRQMHRIQKIQTECELLYRFTNHPEQLGLSYRGVVVDQSDDHMYTIYLYDFQLYCFIKTAHTDDPATLAAALQPGDEHMFRIYIFKDEHTFHKKIRVSI
jgi:hypothetical protein